MSENDLPHSRACGIRCPGHWVGCHPNCPTCHGEKNKPKEAKSKVLTEMEKAYLVEDIQDRFAPHKPEENKSLKITLRAIIAAAVEATIEEMEKDQ